MSTISSPGLASGIDVKSIVSQLVALDRAPLQPLQKTASSLQSKLSVSAASNPWCLGWVTLRPNSPPPAAGAA